MDDKRLVKVSRYLSKHLRHEPERLGLELQPGGWVSVDELLVITSCQAPNELTVLLVTNAVVSGCSGSYGPAPMPVPG